MARKPLELLYTDTCTIAEFRKVVAPNHTTHTEEVIVHENLPCRVSYDTTGYAGDGEFSSLQLVSKIYIAPEIEVKAGSKIYVTRNGITTIYENSGEPARYVNHQEITVDLWKDKA